MRATTQERERDASGGAGSPWFVLVRDPCQFRVERAPTTTGRPPVSTTTTCMPRV
jgi:hypothetical protein